MVYGCVACLGVVKCSTVQSSMWKCSTVQYVEVQCSAVCVMQCSAVLHSTALHCVFITAAASLFPRAALPLRDVVCRVGCACALLFQRVVFLFFKFEFQSQSVGLLEHI